MAMAWFDIDYTVAIAIKKPITFEHGRAFYTNPIAIAEGAADAPRIAVVKSPDGILPAQNALATDETDTFKRLAPDGTGGTRWALPLEGGTVALGGGGTSIVDGLLNAGLWSITAHARSSTGGVIAGSVGQAWVLNGSLLAQSSIVTDLVAPANITFNGTAFSMSGSGSGRTVSFSIPGGGGLSGRIIAARVA